MSRGAGGGTRCRVPPPDPFFPEDRGRFWRPAYGDWNQFILLGPKPSELVLQTGRVSARAGTDGVLGALAESMRGEETQATPSVRRWDAGGKRGYCRYAQKVGIRDSGTKWANGCGNPPERSRAERGEGMAAERNCP